eukprot:TRINITY_DN66313_c6_g1_i1.p1 TRINITY_DN66313_c6_g1~~TRINITY_DN66313_c6_g1_i1.p1  ORF type:complete len:670 (+),score=299.27 TRINITY_DN66313_c6_g1_i1:61-2070(+)
MMQRLASMGYLLCSNPACGTPNDEWRLRCYMCGEELRSLVTVPLPVHDTRADAVEEVVPQPQLEREWSGVSSASGEVRAIHARRYLSEHGVVVPDGAKLVVDDDDVLLPPSVPLNHRGEGAYRYAPTPHEEEEEEEEEENQDRSKGEEEKEKEVKEQLKARQEPAVSLTDARAADDTTTAHEDAAMQDYDIPSQEGQQQKKPSAAVGDGERTKQTVGDNDNQKQPKNKPATSVMTLTSDDAERAANDNDSKKKPSAAVGDGERTKQTVGDNDNQKQPKNKPATSAMTLTNDDTKDDYGDDVVELKKKSNNIANNFKNESKAMDDMDALTMLMSALAGISDKPPRNNDIDMTTTLQIRTLLTSRLTRPTDPEVLRGLAWSCEHCTMENRQPWTPICETCLKVNRQRVRGLGIVKRCVERIQKTPDEPKLRALPLAKIGVKLRSELLRDSLINLLRLIGFEYERRNADGERLERGPHVNQPTHLVLVSGEPEWMYALTIAVREIEYEHTYVEALDALERKNDSVARAVNTRAELETHLRALTPAFKKSKSLREQLCRDQLDTYALLMMRTTRVLIDAQEWEATIRLAKEALPHLSAEQYPSERNNLLHRLYIAFGSRQSGSQIKNEMAALRYFDLMDHTLVKKCLVPDCPGCRRRKQMRRNVAEWLSKQHD